MEFLATNEDVLAFTRSKGEERLLFVFNLRRGPQEISVPAGLKVKESIVMPGLSGRQVGSEIHLGPLDGFCARL